MVGLRNIVRFLSRLGDGDGEGVLPLSWDVSESN